MATVGTPEFGTPEFVRMLQNAGVSEHSIARCMKSWPQDLKEAKVISVKRRRGGFVSQFSYRISVNPGEDLVVLWCADGRLVTLVPLQVN